MRLLLLMLLVLLSVVSTRAQDDQAIVFSRDILPILSDHCYQCHGPDANAGREGDLRLDDAEDAKRDRGGYAVIVEGDAESSELFQRVTSEDDDVMPPSDLGRPLSAEQKSLLKRWIDGGAGWGKHWAFEPIARPEVPTPDVYPIDAFVRTKLDALQWQPNPPADKRTLIRRLSLDLRGLPPTNEEVQAFLADDQPGAWERLVDQFLNSSAYGERMAWEWMDVARYADSNGYQGDGERTMWPWRDWVVRAFNENLPFDQFTVWQIAGDLLPNASDEQVLATGFSRNHMINGEGGRIAEENRVDYVMDMTETMGTAWLGLTLNCCRCHDHKFDPLLQKEYFQFTAFFNQTPVDGSGGNPQTPPVLTVRSDQQRSAEQTLEEKITTIRGKLTTATARLQSELPAWKQRILDSPNDSSPWRTSSLNELVSASGQVLSQDDQGNVLATGANPATDTYSLTEEIASPLRIQSVLLEAIRNPQMTNGGFARSDSGNFVLTDFILRWRPASDQEWQTAKFATAIASFEQGDLKVAKAIDDNPQTGWAVYEGKPATQDQMALFTLAETIEVPAGGTIEFTLRHDSPHISHNLGSFRLSTAVDAVKDLPSSSIRLRSILAAEEATWNDEQRKIVREAQEASDAEFVSLKAELQSNEDQLNRLRGSFPKVMVMADRTERRPTYILDRGLYNEPGDEVTAAVPSFLPALTSVDEAERSEPNRLDLAQWLVADENPLTARVAVNRFWQILFGIGLVKTAEDFGTQAEYPIQKELLEWLAAEFRDSGWNVKQLIRTIVLSETYQQGSQITSPEQFERDPENRYLARAPRFRMPSWMIRDTALAVSGLLNPKVGGPPVFPYQPPGVWAEATFGNKVYRQGTGEDLYRRSLYTFWRRIVGPTVFFDSAKRQVCEVKPLRTNTPLHALTTLNDVTYVEAAKGLAVRTMQATVTEQDDLFRQRIGFAYSTVLARQPNSLELETWKRSYERVQAELQNSPEDIGKLLSAGELQAPAELDSTELAAWTVLCLNLLNLDESLTRE